ncbi:DUF2652 domain-containing protein [Jejudonia soesokkakensis]|uniref:DUF2652 domain-containing protein n=1 Tax=Jejudonia soesokkakensis TaxID=1323432 RepID=A0ABW2MRL4_9FLAO
MKTTPTLLCIPDISGFTKFMKEVDINLSSQVISSLLNNIIYANQIGLKVSEIEGDAVLFFRAGDLPTIKELVDQCKHFYAEFYKQMDVLLTKHKEKHPEIDFPEMLGLKIVLHFGTEIGMVPIGNRIKLMGEDVITAHRFLKNDVPIDEYILISEALLLEYKEKHIDQNFDWGNVTSGILNDEHLGKLRYSYIDLTPLNGEQ